MIWWECIDEDCLKVRSLCSIIVVVEKYLFALYAVLFLSLTLSFFVFPSCTLLAVCKTWWQNIRKERTKRENKNCIFCVRHCASAFLLSPPSPLISAAGENNAVFLILSASVVHKRTIEAIFSRQGIDELYILYTSLSNALKWWPSVLFSLFYFNKCVCANTATLRRFHALVIFFNSNSLFKIWWHIGYFMAISICHAMEVHDNKK